MNEPVITYPAPYRSLPVSFWEALVCSKSEIRCQIVYAKSPEIVYLRFFFDEEVDELTDIRDIMDVHFDIVAPDGTLRPPTKQPIDPSHLIVGLPVSAYLHKDNAFYRAFIVVLEKTRCKCYFIDFGFELWIQMEDISYLPESLHGIESIAIPCKLSQVAPPTAEGYPSSIANDMVTLSNSDSTDTEKMRLDPLVCRIIRVIKPEPSEFESAWRYHQNLQLHLIVELRMPEHSDKIAAQANGFAHLLASLGSCVLREEDPSVDANIKQVDSQKKSQDRSVHKVPVSSITRRENVRSPIKGRGRGRGGLCYSNLQDNEIPPIPFDDDDNFLPR